MVHVDKSEMNKIAHMFDGIQDSMVIACLQGYNGDAYVKSWENPQAALIVSAEYSFFGGDPEAEDADYLVEHFFDVADTDSSTAIFADERPEWENTLMSCKTNHPERLIRYGIVQKDYDFDMDNLQGYIDALPEGYQMESFDEDIYNQAMAEKWSVEFCEGFESAEDFLKRGRGVAVLKDGRLVSGISTQTVYDGGAELQLATHEEYRRCGLAVSCAAALVKECSEAGIRPHWDAANTISKRIALKLGYEYKGEYVAVKLNNNK